METPIAQKQYEPSVLFSLCDSVFSVVEGFNSPSLFGAHQNGKVQGRRLTPGSV